MTISVTKIKNIKRTSLVNNKNTKLILSLVLGLLITACGGSGSDNGGGPSQPITPPSPTPAPVSSIINSSNSIEVATYGTSVSESMLQLAQLVVPLVVQFDSSAASPSNHLCSAQGDIEISFDDADSNNALSVNDGIELVFYNCVETENTQSINGIARLTIVSLFSENFEIDLSSSLQFEDENGRIDFESEQIRIQSDESDDFSRTTIRSIDQVSNISVGNVIESITRYDINYTVDKQSQTYRLDFDFEASSALYNSPIDCESTQDFEGALFQLPAQYSFRCAVSSSNFIEVNRNRGDSDTSIDLFIESKR